MVLNTNDSRDLYFLKNHLKKIIYIEEICDILIKEKMLYVKNYIVIYTFNFL